MIKTFIIPLVSLALNEFDDDVFYAPISNLHHIVLDGRLTIELESIDKRKVR
jgi:hypothetical protein